MVWKLVTSHCGLLLIMVAYSFTGAAIMQRVESYYIEQTIQAENLTHVEDFKWHFILECSPHTLRGGMGSEEEVYRLLEEYEREKQKHEAKLKRIKQYDYWEWLLFTLTVYSTIGTFSNLVLKYMCCWQSG